MKQLKYPEYINGIKQEQNPFKRFCIKIWYSDWFRAFFIMFPVWLYALLIILMINFPEQDDLCRTLVIGVYLGLLIAALAKNDWSELRRIGLDEYHQPLKPDKEDLEED